MLGVEFSPDHVADCMHVTQTFLESDPCQTGPHQHTTPAPPNSLDRAPQWATILPPAPDLRAPARHRGDGTRARSRPQLHGPWRRPLSRRSDWQEARLLGPDQAAPRMALGQHGTMQNFMPFPVCVIMAVLSVSAPVPAVVGIVISVGKGWYVSISVGSFSHSKAHRSISFLAVKQTALPPSIALPPPMAMIAS